MKYFLLVEVTEPDGKTYQEAKHMDLTAAERLVISRWDLENAWNRDSDRSYKILKMQPYMRLEDVGPPWIRAAIGGLIFWIILLALLYLGEAPWLK